MFLSVPYAEALRELQGTRDTTPVLCRSFPLAAAARGIGTDGDCCCNSVHRVEPLTQGSGCAMWRFGGQGARDAGPADRFARSEELTRGELVTWGCHALRQVVCLGKQGHIARRHYWRVPVVTTLLAQGLAQCRTRRGCSSLTSECAAPVRTTGSVVCLTQWLGSDADRGKVGV